MANRAAEIYQSWLDATSHAILHGDKDVVARHIALPYLHAWTEGHLVIETRADMEKGHLQYGKALRAHGATDLVRVVEEAEFLGPCHIAGRHRVHVLRGGSPVLDSFSTRLVLKQQCCNWQMIESHMGIDHRSWPVEIIRNGQQIELEVADPGDARRCLQDARTIYQILQNKLSRTLLTGDFEAYNALIDLPFRAHTLACDHVTETLDDARAGFDAFHRFLMENGVDDYQRHSLRAEYIGRDELCGFHVCRFLRDGAPAHAPITSRMFFRKTENGWRIRSMTHALANDTYPFVAPQVASHLPTEIDIHERTKSWLSLH